MMEKFIAWLDSDSKRVGYEWAQCGPELTEGLALAEAQYQRIVAAREKYGITDDMMREWRGI